MNQSTISIEPFLPLGDPPLVSVIIACFNHQNYIQDTVDSVLNQDYGNIELIVVDGGSTDGTLDLLRKCESDPRFRWISEADEGPNEAYAKGLKMARGSLIGLQNSSDTYELSAVREAVKEFAADPRLAFVGGGTVKEIDVDGRPNGAIWRTSEERFYYSVEDIVSIENYPADQAIFIRREIVEAIGGLNPEYKWLRTYFHMHCMLEASRLGGLSLCIPSHWANYRRHPNPLHDAFKRKEIGLRVHQERNWSAKELSHLYKGNLSPELVKRLRRPGYRLEFGYRVGSLRELIPAIPSFLGYLRFGGRQLLPKKRGLLSYVGLFAVGFLSKHALGSQKDS